MSKAWYRYKLPNSYPLLTLHHTPAPGPPCSSTVRGIDWSTDSSILQSDSADMELLVWNARTGGAVRSYALPRMHAQPTCNRGRCSLQVCRCGAKALVAHWHGVFDAADGRRVMACAVLGLERRIIATGHCNVQLA